VLASEQHQIGSKHHGDYVHTYTNVFLVLVLVPTAPRMSLDLFPYLHPASVTPVASVCVPPPINCTPFFHNSPGSAREGNQLPN